MNWKLNVVAIIPNLLLFKDEIFSVPGEKEMMSHVDDRCKNLLDDNDYSTVMTQIKLVR